MKEGDEIRERWHKRTLGKVIHGSISLETKTKNRYRTLHERNKTLTEPLGWISDTKVPDTDVPTGLFWPVSQETCSFFRLTHTPGRSLHRVFSLTLSCRSLGYSLNPSEKITPRNLSLRHMTHYIVGTSQKSSRIRVK